jgi:hypothetical protein
MGISHRVLQLYVKLSSAVVAILVGILKCRTQFWKRTTQESFQQSLVEIGSVVSQEKIFLLHLVVLPSDQDGCTAVLSLA